jgi:branched-chain amino acid transport system ATP-binding protein
MLEVRDLDVAYDGSVAVSGIDLVVPDGSVVGVLGPNGAGKSTLLKTIAGLVRPERGTITFDGERIDGCPAHEVVRRGVVLVPEQRGILPGLTVRDNLKLSKAGTDRFPLLAERLDQQAGTLSGGEQQMLALARALASDPALLLLDEPSLGLAPRVLQFIDRTIDQLQTERRTVLWVEQYASHVLRRADLVYILGRGRVVWAGEPAELRASPVLVRSYLGGASA